MRRIGMRHRRILAIISSSDACQFDQATELSRQKQLPANLRNGHLGAARAVEQTIFGVVADPTFTTIPPALLVYTLYIGRIEDVIRAIKLIVKNFQMPTSHAGQQMPKLSFCRSLALAPSNLEEL